MHPSTTQTLVFLWVLGFVHEKSKSRGSEGIIGQSVISDRPISGDLEKSNEMYFAGFLEDHALVAVSKKQGCQNIHAKTVSVFFFFFFFFFCVCVCVCVYFSLNRDPV